MFRNSTVRTWRERDAHQKYSKQEEGLAMQWQPQQARGQKKCDPAQMPLATRPAIRKYSKKNSQYHVKKKARTATVRKGKKNLLIVSPHSCDHDELCTSRVRDIQSIKNIVKINIHASCEIKDFAETRLCKLCVILRSRVYGLCVLIKDIGRQLPLQLQCSYQGPQGDVSQSVRGNYKTRF